MYSIGSKPSSLKFGSMFGNNPWKPYYIFSKLKLGINVSILWPQWFIPLVRSKSFATKSCAINMFSCSLFNSNSQSVQTSTCCGSLLSPSLNGNKYFIGNNRCNPYTNWKGVWPILTLLVVQYENKIVNTCSSQPFLFSLTTLVSKVPKTLFVYLAYPFPCG